MQIARQQVDKIVNRKKIAEELETALTLIDMDGDGIVTREELEE